MRCRASRPGTWPSAEDQTDESGDGGLAGSVVNSSLKFSRVRLALGRVPQCQAAGDVPIRSVLERQREIPLALHIVLLELDRLTSLDESITRITLGTAGRICDTIL